jgi:hypothetical protein
MRQTHAWVSVRLVVQDRIVVCRWWLTGAFEKDCRGHILLAHVRSMGQKLVASEVDRVHEQSSSFRSSLRVLVKDRELLFAPLQRRFGEAESLEDGKMVSEGGISPGIEKLVNNGPRGEPWLIILYSIPGRHMCSPSDHLHPYRLAFSRVSI